jgi:hypothetical protein
MYLIYVIWRYTVDSVLLEFSKRNQNALWRVALCNLERASVLPKTVHRNTRILRTNLLPDKSMLILQKWCLLAISILQTHTCMAGLRSLRAQIPKGRRKVWSTVTRRLFDSSVPCSKSSGQNTSTSIWFSELRELLLIRGQFYHYEFAKIGVQPETEFKMCKIARCRWWKRIIMLKETESSFKSLVKVTYISKL